MSLFKEMCKNCEDTLHCNNPYMDGECTKFPITRPDNGIPLPTRLKIELVNSITQGNPLSSEED